MTCKRINKERSKNEREKKRSNGWGCKRIREIGEGRVGSVERKGMEGMVLKDGRMER